MKNKINKFNEYIGDKLANGLSTMQAFYIVSAFVLIPLLFQTPHDLVGWIQYIIQSFFQGAALPVLAYVSKIQGTKTEKILNETHDNLLVEIQSQNTEIAEIKELLDLVKDENLEIHAIMSGLLEIQCKINNK